jgi:hypothetical protein
MKLEKTLKSTTGLMLVCSRFLTGFCVEEPNLVGLNGLGHVLEMNPMDLLRLHPTLRPDLLGLHELDLP